MSEFIEKNKTIISIAAFVIVAVAMLVVSVLVAKCPVPAACVLLVIEVAIAALLHNAELWFHGVFVIVELIAGLLTGKIVLVALLLLVYLAATLALRFIK